MTSIHEGFIKIDRRWCMEHEQMFEEGQVGCEEFLGITRYHYDGTQFDCSPHELYARKEE